MIKKKMIEKSYELPDGQVITIGNELFRTTETLFSPELAAIENIGGIHELIFATITNCDPELHNELFHNIVLAGGCSMFPGLAERIKIELESMVALAYPLSAKIDIKVIAPPERKYSTWIGASIVGSISTFASQVMTKEEYDEQGPALAHAKFF